jgi:hypothetical protein
VDRSLPRKPALGQPEVAGQRGTRGRARSVPGFDGALALVLPPFGSMVAIAVMGCPWRAR